MILCHEVDIQDVLIQFSSLRITYTVSEYVHFQDLAEISHNRVFNFYFESYLTLIVLSNTNVDILVLKWRLSSERNNFGLGKRVS